MQGLLALSQGLGLSLMEFPWLGFRVSGTSQDCVSDLQWGLMPGSEVNCSRELR